MAFGCQAVDKPGIGALSHVPFRVPPDVVMLGHQSPPELLEEWYFRYLEGVEHLKRVDVRVDELVEFAARHCLPFRGQH